MSQVFQGLAYLNEDGRRIIHYDLKPGNILFDSLGRVRITVGSLLPACRFDLRIPVGSPRQYVLGSSTTYKKINDACIPC